MFIWNKYELESLFVEEEPHKYNFEFKFNSDIPSNDANIGIFT